MHASSSRHALRALALAIRPARPLQPTTRTPSSLLARQRPACLRPHTRSLHATATASRQQPTGKPPKERRPTDFAELDVFADTPVPATAIESCGSDDFKLSNGSRIMDGDGVLLVVGEAFAWRPWVAKGSKVLVNARGQWEVPAEAFALLGLLWPRPDLLILGIGAQMRPISPETRRAIAELGMRVEVLDTRNAAAQFNLLATERGVDEVAAALIPVGWEDGVGAK